MTIKATVIVRLKPEVLDVQGSAVQRALGKLGFEGVKGVRVGKIVELELDDTDGADPSQTKDRLEKMAKDMLANPVIEDFEI
ncbi:MAG TPA: phosphoribosylformylglycinamidine synthase subunit PurS, partial [Polyangiaceae bacterium]